MSTYRSLYNELTAIISRHVAELTPYIPNLTYAEEAASPDLLARIDRLVEITGIPAQQATSDLYFEACECHDSLNTFLRVMNTDEANVGADDTMLGQVLAQVACWRKAVTLELVPPTTDVWGVIAPARPDHLVELGNGEYEARWWKPVPVMDIEMMQYTESVVVCGEPFEPAELPGGLALRFSLVPRSANAHIDEMGT